MSTFKIILPYWSLELSTRRIPRVRMLVCEHSSYVHINEIYCSYLDVGYLSIVDVSVLCTFSSA